MNSKPTFRKTKIIATIGPSCDDVKTMLKMIQSGMNVARLNLSHGSHEEHSQRVSRIRQASEEAGSRVAIMIDTKGIEIRTGALKGGFVHLSRDAGFVLYTDERPG